MKIAIFGGAFDPPHVGHLKVVRNFLQLNLVDEVWFLPVKDHAFAKKMASEVDRLAMLELLVSRHLSALPVLICREELEQPGMSITYQTLKALSTQHPEHQFSFLLGSDNLKSFHQWHDYKKLLQDFSFYVYPRIGFDFGPLRPGMTALKNLEEMAISSTEVKRRLLAKSDTTDLISPEIAEYLRTHHLYLT